MKPRLSPKVFFAFLLLAGGETLAGPRSWTNAQGKQVQAEFGGVKDGGVVLIMAGGQSATVPLTSLSAEDQAWVRENASKVSATAEDAADAARVPLEKRRMPTEVKEPMLYMNIKVVKEVPGECIYESGHFQFKTSAKLGAVLMKDVCRAFESTYELVRLMPWGIVPKPEEGRKKFQAELYATRDQYLASGAPPWSAGVYVRKDKVFRMPFDELGISDTPGANGAYYRRGAINNDTITHEITHQMMHEYIEYMPIWLAEGLAEYTSNMDYKGGLFSVAGDSSAFVMRKPGSRSRGLFASRNYAARWVGVTQLWDFTTSITQPNPIRGLSVAERQKEKEETQAGRRVVFMPPPNPAGEMAGLAERYHSAHVLAYFFVHDNGGQRLMQYFDALHEEKKKWPPFWDAVKAYNAEVARLKPAYAIYRDEVRKFMRQDGVKDLGNGRFSYPSDLKPPTPPPDSPAEPQPPDGTDPEAVCAKHLNILLGGRSLKELETDVRAMFEKNGLAL